MTKKSAFHHGELTGFPVCNLDSSFGIAFGQTQDKNSIRCAEVRMQVVQSTNGDVHIKNIQNS
jgi:hypothetical protein